MGLAHRQAARRRFMLRHERALWAQGLTHVAGVDEVGVGPLAGPLVAAAVILPTECEVRGIDDSKKVPAARRRTLRAEIEACAIAIGVGVVEVGDVDRLNTYWASIEAMRRAVAEDPLGRLSRNPRPVVVPASGAAFLGPLNHRRGSGRPFTPIADGGGTGTARRRARRPWRRDRR